MVLSKLATRQVVPRFVFSTLLESSARFQAPQAFSMRMHHTSHALFFMRHASQRGTRVTCVCNGRARNRLLQSGFIKFQIADEEIRTYSGHAWPRDHIDSLLIPEFKAKTVAEQEGFDASRLDVQSFVRINDKPLQQRLTKVLQLLRAPASPHLADYAEAATRELLINVFENGVGRLPPWRKDNRGFDPKTFGCLLELIDANLAVPPPLEDAAAMTAFSASHFARKFRNSTGQSFHRFINTRRVQFAIQQLTSSRADLASLSLDLGFSSQSHFTRVFKAMTGLTPAHLRR